MPSNVFFTVVANNYAAYAQVLMRSVQRHHPQSERYIIVCDDLSAGGPSSAFAQILCVEDLDIPEFEAMKLRYDVMEFSTAIKPYSALFLDKRHPGANIIYLDPDILVTAPLSHVEDALSGGAEVVLTPHITSPLQDRLMPDDLTIMKSGIYNLGFAAFRVKKESRLLLEWWRDRCTKDAIVDIADNKFTDQRWMDMAPAFVRKTHILHHPGYNLAYWNLSHRKVATKGSEVLVDGEPLRFVHFSGVNPASPDSFSKHQNRFLAKDLGELRPLFDAYVAEVRGEGWEKSRQIPYAFGRFQNGRSINRYMRLAFRRRDEEISPDEAMRDGVLFDQPAADLIENGPPKITLLMHELWLDRADLQREFNIKESADRKRFLEWTINGGGAGAGFDKISIDAAENLLRPKIIKKALTPWEPQTPKEGAVAPGDLDSWLAEPISVNILLSVGAPPMPRHLALLWEMRSDLQEHFPCQTQSGLWEYFSWCLSEGALQHVVDPALIAPAIETFLDYSPQPGHSGAPPVTRLMEQMSSKYSGAHRASALELPDTKASLLAHSIWLIGKATTTYGWPSSFTQQHREWSLGRSSQCKRTEVPITNLMYAIWTLRPDIRKAFDLKSRRSQQSFLAWLICFGMREFGLPLQALPDEVFKYIARPIWRGVNGARLFHALCHERRSELKKFDVARFDGRQELVSALNAEKMADQWSVPAWLEMIDRVGEPSMRWPLISNLIFARKPKLQPLLEKNPVKIDSNEPVVLLSGLQSHTSGRGEDLRLTAVSLESVGVEFKILDRFNNQQTVWRNGKPLRGVNIAHLNAETAASDYVFFRRAGAASMRAVGYWAWELSLFPDAWKHAFSYYDEIWAATQFAYESFASATKKPIVKAPLTVEAPEINRALTRKYFDIPESAFIFYFGFDFRSFVARKNPYAAINAFKAAFPNPDCGAVLLLKTLGGKAHPQEFMKLKNAVRLDKRFIIQDMEYSRVEMASLINLCDAYVSLHRSEGFGRGPAEAMLLGKPVIATAYSGNMDYMTSENSCLVDYKLIPVQPGEYPGFEKQVWADALVDHAGHWMAKVASDRAFAQSLGQKAKATIERLYSPKIVGPILENHLKRLSPE